MQVVLVPVVGEQLRRCASDTAGAHRHDVEGDVVDLARLDRAEEVGDAEVRRLRLAGEPEARDLAVARLVLPDDEVVAVAVGGEVAVDDRGLQQVVGLGLRQLARAGSAGCAP